MDKERDNAEEIGHKPRMAGRVKELEAEIVRLKRAVAVLTVDKLILQEVAEENGMDSSAKLPSGEGQ